MSVKTYIKSTSFEDFDPNDMQENSDVWAVYDGAHFRTFGSRGSALTSFLSDYRSKLYWLQDDGMWRLIAKRHNTYPPMDAHCDHCFGPGSSDPYGNRLKYVFEKNARKIPPGPDGVNLVALCNDCRRLNG